MKTKLLMILSAAVLFGACSMKSGDPMDGAGDGMYEPGGTGTESGEGQEYAGKVTAGEWRDLDNWLFWSDLMNGTIAGQDGQGYASTCDYWGFYTNNRVAVRVTNEAGQPQRDVPVQLVQWVEDQPNVLCEGRTDNKGEVNMFIGLTQKIEEIDASHMVLGLNGNIPIVFAEPPMITHWGEEVKWNPLMISQEASKNIDIAFIVDATGSMSDEINFLKADLTDIINKVGEAHADANIRTAALFYRDEGDDYLTRVSDFTDDLSVTTNYIAKQKADGGGDYPEAVHTALEVGLQKLSWREDNSIRLAFMLLDAPPHKQDDVLASLHQSIPQYAKRGIRIIPVAASGVDKNTEFFLRFTAIATDGTYVFITNHSGVGGDHIEATVGAYKVELLNDLMVRLIDQYLE